MIDYSLMREKFLVRKNVQEFPASKLEELAHLGNVRRWKTLRLGIRGGGWTSFYIHGDHSPHPDADADADT